jgi:uncharacterized repeat protein (TIGR01451 family)
MDNGLLRSARGRLILLLSIACLSLSVHAAEIDLQTEILAAPIGADPGDTVVFTMSYSNASATDAEDARVRLILPSGVFLDWSTQDMQTVADSLVDSLGYTGDVELDQDSCDNILVSIMGSGGAPPLIPANDLGQFSVDISLPDDIPTRGVFEVHTPLSVAGYYDFTVGRCDSCADLGTCFGGPISTSAPTTTELELVNDPSGSEPTEGCGTLEAFTAGNIALIRRGTCNFGTKALNAQNAGATGVVIVNSTADVNIHSFTMNGGADGTQVTVPVVLIGKEDGDSLIAALDAKTAIEATLGGVADKRRLILSCGGGMPPGVSTENLKAFLDAMH